MTIRYVSLPLLKDLVIIIRIIEFYIPQGFGEFSEEF